MLLNCNFLRMFWWNKSKYFLNWIVVVELQSWNTTNENFEIQFQKRKMSATFKFGDCRKNKTKIREKCLVLVDFWFSFNLKWFQSEFGYEFFFSTISCLKRTNCKLKFIVKKFCVILFHKEYLTKTKL